MGRIRDTLRTLFGRSEAQVEIARMRAQFVNLMVDVASALEKLNTMAARLAKREARALRAVDDPAASPAEPPPLEIEEGERIPGAISSRKAALYRKSRERRSTRVMGSTEQ